MTARVLIIGGYGNFGSYIARSLKDDVNIKLLIGGRSAEKAQNFSASLSAFHPPEGHAIDIDGYIFAAFTRIAPDLVIHTTGPFQTQDYRVAKACIAYGCHYLDLADARDFVVNINTLDAEAKSKNILVVSGASSVPCLTAAIIDSHLPEFMTLEKIDYGISAAQQTNRGLATTAAILSYVGKPFTMLRDGELKTVYGWEDTHAEFYPELGRRWFGNCDVPDLTLFPKRYPALKFMRFAAGHELAILHFGTRLLGAFVKMGFIRSLDKYAQNLLRLAFLFDRFGSGKSGFHMILSGRGRDGTPRENRFTMIARSGHGPFIPCVPAIIMARRLAAGEVKQRGALACLDFIDLDSYLAALTHLDIEILKGATIA
jgi:hypothetical protein